MLLPGLVGGESRIAFDPRVCLHAGWWIAVQSSGENGHWRLEDSLRGLFVYVFTSSLTEDIIF